jgi:hypothetical protein
MKHGVLKMDEDVILLIVCFFEIVASIVIGSLFHLSGNTWMGVLIGGIILIVSMIVNAKIFAENKLLIYSLVIFGLVSFLTIPFGTYYTYGLTYAIGASLAVIIIIGVLIVLQLYERKSPRKKIPI